MTINEVGRSSPDLARNVWHRADRNGYDVKKLNGHEESKHYTQHVVEVLNTLDVGSSFLLAAQPRADFTMATALEAVAAIVQRYGLPDVITIDRDSRFVGSHLQRDCPSPFLRFWLCLGVQVQVCPPRRPDLNGFVERYHRSYCTVSRPRHPQAY